MPVATVVAMVAEGMTEEMRFFMPTPTWSLKISVKPYCTPPKP